MHSLTFMQVFNLFFAELVCRFRTPIFARFEVVWFHVLFCLLRLLCHRSAVMQSLSLEFLLVFYELLKCSTWIDKSITSVQFATFTANTMFLFWKVQALYAFFKSLLQCKSLFPRLLLILLGSDSTIFLLSVIVVVLYCNRHIFPISN